MADSAKPVHTFDIHGFDANGPARAGPFRRRALVRKSLSWWAFVLLFIGFVIKLPAVPVHTWLPDAHVEAPTPISMILAGVLLKMGGYGILRFCYPICPDAAYYCPGWSAPSAWLSMIYGALASMAQKDFKRLVAYSSVSHMGYVLLGIAVWSAAAGNKYNTDYWQMGMNGAMFQMIAHGLSSAGMFFMVGVFTTACITATWTSSAGCSRGCRWRAGWPWEYFSPPWVCPDFADLSASFSWSWARGVTAPQWRSSPPRW